MNIGLGQLYVRRRWNQWFEGQSSSALLQIFELKFVGAEIWECTVYTLDKLKVNVLHFIT